MKLPKLGPQHLAEAKVNTRSNKALSPAHIKTLHKDNMKDKIWNRRLLQRQNEHQMQMISSRQRTDQTFCKTPSVDTYQTRTKAGKHTLE
jgi:hypothetical protein